MEDNRAIHHQSSSSPSLSSSKTPFDWLQGTLFFGGTKSSSVAGNTTSEISTGADTTLPTDDNDFAIINNSNDPVFLLTGLSKNLNDLVSLMRQQPLNNATTDIAAPNGEATKKGITSELTFSLLPPGEITATSLSDSIAIYLSRLRFLLYDERRLTSQHHPSTEWKHIKPVIAMTTVNAFEGSQLPVQHLLPMLLEYMILLPFESRKNLAAIFNYLLVCGLEGVDASLYWTCMTVFVSYIRANFVRIMTIIVQGHDSTQTGITPDIILHFGSMYRCCARHPTLYHQLVGTQEHAQRFVYPFLDEYVHVANFEISSDAMESLRAVFAANTDRSVRNTNDNQTEQLDQLNIADIAAEFLYRDYEAIWDERFTPKLLSDSANYISRRVALQILSTVLLTRTNYSIMIRYVASRTNLIVIMHLLRDTSPHITLDAFHVFKVFVANPNKPPEIVKILRDNKVKLSAYLLTLHQDKEENDTQFRDEKALIIATIDSQ